MGVKVSELYALWVEQAYNDARKKVNEDNRALKGLNPDGDYAAAIKGMLALHEEAAKVYERALIDVMRKQQEAA